MYDISDRGAKAELIQLLQLNLRRVAEVGEVKKSIQLSKSKFERSQQTLVFEGAPFQDFLCLHFAE